MAIPQEVVKALNQSVASIAQARFLFSKERGDAAQELERALNSLRRNGDLAVAAADDIVAAQYQVANGLVPAADEEAFLAKLAMVVRRAKNAVSNAKNELANTKTAVTVATPILGGTALANGLNGADTLMTALNDVLNPTVEPEPEP